MPKPPEICEAIRKAATTAGRLISLRTWSTESIASSPKSKCKSARSIRPLHGLQIACQNLVRVGCPGHRQQRQNRNDGQCFHAAIVVFDCGQKSLSLAPFLDRSEKQSWPRESLFDHLIGARDQRRRQSSPGAVPAFRLTSNWSLVGCSTGCRPVWSAVTHNAKAYTSINVIWRTLADIRTSDHSSSRQVASAAGASRAMKNPPGNPIPGIAAPGAGQHWFPKRLNDARHRFIVMLENLMRD
jgi:hypothetical protein